MDESDGIAYNWLSYTGTSFALALRLLKASNINEKRGSELMEVYTWVLI